MMGLSRGRVRGDHDDHALVGLFMEGILTHVPSCAAAKARSGVGLITHLIPFISAVVMDPLSRRVEGQLGGHS